MNAPANVTAAHQATQAANISRMADMAARWAKKPQDDYRKLQFLDALAHCIDADLSDDMDACRYELRIDEEGFPITDDGDRDTLAERVFIPSDLAPLSVARSVLK